jgi:membrane glycosyltransferase
MAPATLVALAATMEAEPELGILQTAPALAGARTPFARLQQFASRIYGPVVARGLAAWQGGDGNYWGHNAIIRTAAFAASCGLPELPGKQPLGGPILSHDFVEAALMRRAGWRVEMATDLGGSWEDSPPSLIDAAARDRRWAQGNLQHLKVIGARGLRWPSRVHLAIGVMSYCASPIWLLLIGFGFALSLQTLLNRPEYFPEGFQLFPTWPLFDSERMVRLFIATLAVLFLPKAIGLVSAFLSRKVRRGCGGAWRLLASGLAELVLSALYAPIMMLIHSRQVAEILLGRDSGWGPQRREGGETSWRDAWRAHRWHMGIGAATAGAAWFVSPMILAWLAPTLLGLFFAVPLSKLSGSAGAGAAMRRMGLLATPEERDPHPILAEHEAARERFPHPPKDGVLALAGDPMLREAHYRWARPATRRRGAPDGAALTAAHKIAEAETLVEALTWLDARERVHVAGHRTLMDQMLRLPRFQSVRSEEPFSDDDVREPERERQLEMAIA